MASFLGKRWKPGAAAASSPTSKDVHKKKEEQAPEVTPLEKMLQNAGTLRPDGSDKFFGMENFGNTCYCNSIVQVLYYTLAFRQQVLNFPPLTPSDTPNGNRPKSNVQIRVPNANGNAQSDANGTKRGATTPDPSSKKKTGTPGPPLPGQPVRPEDKPDTPEYKKKQAMLKGPIYELAQENDGAYGMPESMFTAMKDIFSALVDSDMRTGVLSPQRLLDIFKRDNELFRNSNHQDAHEFYGLVLNNVITNVESHAQQLLNNHVDRPNDGMTEAIRAVLGATAKSTSNGMNSPGTGWVHDIFEGVSTSETKCLTCETASQRDETFLDLSIDLEEHASVTSCLQKYSAEEMLCERNKFHCDHCGGLQEAEKRMKIKRLPKVLALHLKRFKWTEDYSRLQKLFHRVVYPYQLRMFNTTEDTYDPDRLYELYAVVIHIGGNAYHGHYVSVIKTEDRGWLLFDDEMVEPVDKHYVRNFFGDKPGMACAYVLFYQETTFDKVRAEQDAEGLEEVRIVSEKAGMAQENGQLNGHLPGLTKQVTQPTRPAEDHDALVNLDHAHTVPGVVNSPTTPISLPVSPTQADDEVPPIPPLPQTPTRSDTVKTESRSKGGRTETKAQKKEREKAEKEELKAKERIEREARARLLEARRNEQHELRKAIEESKKIAAEEDSKRKEKDDVVTSLSRSKTGRNMARRSFGFLNRDKAKRDSSETTTSDHAGQNGETSTPAPTHHDASEPKPEHHFKLKKSFSFGIGRKKSQNFHS